MPKTNQTLQPTTLQISHIKGHQDKGKTWSATYHPRNTEHWMWQKGKQSHANYAQQNTDQSSHDNHWLPTPYHWWHHTVLTSSAPIKNSSNKKRIPNVPPKQISMDQQSIQLYSEDGLPTSLPMTSNQWTMIYQQTHPWVAASTGQPYNGKCIQSATLPIMSKITGNTWTLFAMPTPQ